MIIKKIPIIIHTIQIYNNMININAINRLLPIIYVIYQFRPLWYELQAWFFTRIVEPRLIKSLLI